MSPSSRNRTLVRLLAALTIAFTLAGVIASAVAWHLLDRAGVFEPDDHLIEKITTHETRSNTVVVARDGSKLGEFYELDRIFVAYGDIPAMMVNAVVAIEDQNFWKHHGVDPKGIVRAAIANISGGRTRQGASTISQQLVKAFILGKERTFKRKAREIFLAMKLERQIDKRRIMELYLNEMFLGNGSYGVAAAAKRYFNKSLRQLETHEMAVVAGLFQSPSAYNPARHPARAKARQRQVLQAMFRNKFITRDERDKLFTKPLLYRSTASREETNSAPWFLDHVREEANRILGSDIKGGGLVIRTTLDPGLQAMAVASTGLAPAVFRRFERGGRIEAALLATDHKTGAILAMTGGRDYRVSQFNRTFAAKRHPGSAFKTFVYALALKQGWTWADRLFIDPVQIEGYAPRNMTDEFFTEMTLLRAFYKSLNTPAVEVAHKLGVAKLVEFAQQLGIKTKLKQELGTALGGSEVTMADMATAYGTIASMGQVNELYAIESISGGRGEVLYSRAGSMGRPPSPPPLDPETSWLVTEGLRAVMRHGTAHDAAHLAASAVGKTGTSNDGVDNWFAGYTAAVTAIVWAGRDDHQPIDSATGASLALPIWQHFIAGSLQELQWKRQFDKPDGIVEARIDPTYGRPAASGMVMAFRQGSQPGAGSRLRNSIPAESETDAAGARRGQEIPDIFAR